MSELKLSQKSNQRAEVRIISLVKTYLKSYPPRSVSQVLIADVIVDLFAKQRVHSSSDANLITESPRDMHGATLINVSFIKRTVRPSAPALRTPRALTSFQPLLFHQEQRGRAAPARG